LIQGPAFIGKGSVVKAHSSIYHDTSIGEVCKVGGEIEATIIHSYTNKQHDGFLGHSYIGSWVNLGASTNNSDLKNNYSSVSVLIKGKNVDTKSQFVGLIMGDHSKTAINTMFNTGTIVGVSSNIFGSGFPPRYIPSFSWGGSDFIRNYDIEKCLEVARVVLGRRKIQLTQAEEELLRDVYEMTKHEKGKKS
jgi:UDP-N-acetylglucosamine diphosphorylase/glucosamine-1-phosphate N-acetyltransferase